VRALSIRQPFAELILRGTKTIEYRTRATRIIGERFWIYAAKGSGAKVGDSATKRPPIIGENIEVPTAPLPPWMIELAEGLRLCVHRRHRLVHVRCARPRAKRAPRLRVSTSRMTPTFQLNSRGGL